MQYKPKSIGALHIALGGLPGHMRIEVEFGHCSVRKDRRRTPKDNLVAREFGDNNAAGTPFRKRGKSKQGERRNSLPTETVGRIDY